MIAGKVKNSAYKGFQICSLEMRMTVKMWLQVALACLILQLVTFVFLVWNLVPAWSLELFGKLQLAKLTRGLFIDPIFTFSGRQIRASTLLQLEQAHRIAAQTLAELELAGMISGAAYLLFVPLLTLFKLKAGKATQVEHIRGMRLSTEKDLADALKKETGLLPFASVILPSRYEAEHVMIAGKTQVGKTVALMQQLSAIRAARLPAIVHDFKGEYVEKFYRQGVDHIANPLDARGISWNIFDDISTVPDISAVTGSLIPKAGGDDRFWSAAAQDVLRGVVAALYAKGKRTHEDLWQALTSPTPDIAKMCASVPQGAAGLKYIEDDSSRQAASVIAVLMSYVSWLEFARNGSGFSIKRWLSDPKGSFIFLTGRPEVENTLRPYVSLLVDLLGKKLLSSSDNLGRRIYFVLDEFGNLQKLPTIKRLLTAGGSKGATVLLGFQDFAAVVKIYQREDAETILNSCGTSLILKLNDEATAKIFSGRFGETQYWDSSETRSMGPADARDGVSLVRTRTTEKLILPSEIQGLPKLVGYLLIPEHEPAKVRLQITKANRLPALNEAFIIRPGLSLDDIEERQAVLVAEREVALGVVKKPAPEILTELEEASPSRRELAAAETTPRTLSEDLDF